MTREGEPAGATAAGEPTRRWSPLTWIADLRVRTKIALVVGFTLLTTVAVATTGIHEAGRLHDDIRVLNHRNVAGLSHINKVQLALGDVILNGIQARTAEITSRRELQIREDAAIIMVDQAFREYQRTPADDHQWRSRVKNFEAFWKTFREMSKTLQSAPEDSESYSRAKLRYTAALQRVKWAVGDLAAYERDAADIMSRQASSTYNDARRTIAITFLVGVLIALLLIRSVARAIVQPLVEVQQVLGAVASGDLTQRARVRSRDEVGLMARYVNQASDGLRANLLELDAVYQEVRHQATHDGLTDLANRRFFEERLEELLELGDPVSLLIVDLDDFKGVNDRLGHQVGDDLLVGASQRLLSIVRPDDMVARLGGDEFALLLSDGPPAERGVMLARLEDSFHLPIQAGEYQLVVRCSAGQADSWPGADSTELFRRADVAMYAAKARGKGRGAQYDPTLDHHARHVTPREQRSLRS